MSPTRSEPSASSGASHLVLKVLALFVAVVVLAVWISIIANQIGPAPQVVLAETAPEAVRVVVAQLAEYRAEAESLRVLAQALIALGSLYAIALGVTQYFAVAQIARRAELSATAVETMRAELTKSYPMLEGLGRQLDVMVTRVNAVFEGSEDLDFGESIQRLSPQNRLELSRVESLLPLYDHHAGPNVELSKMFAGVGRFHLIAGVQAVDRASEEELMLHRARHLLESAMRFQPQNFMALNDLSVTLWRLHRREDARLRANESLRIEPAQQRALYNLSRFAKDEQQYETAIQHLTAALAGDRVWQVGQSAGRARDIRYNRACYRSLLGQEMDEGGSLTPGNTLAGEALSDLRQSAHPSLATYFEEDLKDGGDLIWLATRNQGAIDNLRARFDGNAAGH